MKSSVNKLTDLEAVAEIDSKIGAAPINKDKLFECAKKGQINIISDSRIALVRDNKKRTPLHHLALRGFLNKDGTTPFHWKITLQHPKVAVAKDSIGMTPLHWLASNGVKEVLAHSKVTMKDAYGITALHFLAREKVLEVLRHPKVAVIKDSYGNTPLHWLAARKVREVLTHPKIDSVKNNAGQTPKDVYVGRC